MFVPNNGVGSSDLKGKQHKLTNESGSSERFRMDHVKRERQRVEKERAKIQLIDKKRIHERNKIDIQHREIELRRLQGEAMRAQVDLDQYKHLFEEADAKAVKVRHDAAELGEKIQKLQLELAQLRNKSEKLSGDLAHVISDKEYKKKMYEGKEATYHEAEEKKKRQAFEIERVRGENIRLEGDIRILEQKIK